jgi:hypothetical protein
VTSKEINGEIWQGESSMRLGLVKTTSAPSIHGVSMLVCLLTEFGTRTVKRRL